MFRFPRWLLLVLTCCLCTVAHAAVPTLFAAASLKPALDTLAADGALGNPAPRLVYAASSQLARQIVQGAPADLFVSADEDWMDYVADHGMLAKGSRDDLLGNTLVLVGAKAAAAVNLHDMASVRAALGDGRLAIALPDTVPAGRYARAALKSLHLWSALKDHLAPARDVRAALALVLRGACPLGVVYGSDATSQADAHVLAVFPATSHAPIVYPMARVRGHDDDATRALQRALHGADAAKVFRHFGFTPLATP